MQTCGKQDENTEKKNKIRRDDKKRGEKKIVEEMNKNVCRRMPSTNVFISFRFVADVVDNEKLSLI